MSSVPQEFQGYIKLGVRVSSRNDTAVYRIVSIKSIIARVGVYADQQTQTAVFRALRLLAIRTWLTLDEAKGIASSTPRPDVEDDTDAEDALLRAYYVEFTYLDMDNDIVLIGSAPELRDTLRWSNSAVRPSQPSRNTFKILATVRPVVAVVTNEAMAANEEVGVTMEVGSAAPPPATPSSNRSSSSSAASTSADTATQTPTPATAPRESTAPPTPNPTPPPPPPPIVHHIVDALVGILGPALEAVRHAGEAAPAQPIISTPRSSAPATETATAEETASNVEDVTPAAEATAPEETAADCAAATPSPATATPPPVPTTAETRPFVHGRHTCDGCLTTPIVGTRYHSLDLPDYDLCSNCHANYGGGLRFEPAELERDRPFQDRWSRRRSLLAGGGGGVGPRRHGRPHYHHGPHFVRGRGGPPFGPGRRGCHGGPSTVVFGSAPAPATGPVPTVPTPEEVDGALKEAIRRSLQDLRDQETNTKARAADPAPTAPTVSEEAAAVAAPPAVAAAASSSDPPSSKGTPSARYSVHEDLDDEDDHGAEVDKDKIAQDPKIEVAADATLTETLEAAAAESPAPAQSPPTSPNAATKTTPLIDAASQGAGVNYSFASDAEGNGDVAAALGEMMDKVANCISEMNCELERKPPAITPTAPNHTNNNTEEPETVVPPSVGAADDSKNRAGATIVDGEDDPTDGVGSNGSWDEVDDAFGANEEEALARAAMVIGSSLLSSDMANSTTGQSAAAAESVSSVGSVPTTVPSIATDHRPVAAPPQLERWAFQLQHLHELGFHDDALLVDIIERLNAANIGVDSTEEVTVRQVINELMKEW